MKKNAMLKIAAILMVAVLLTTCAISSTFAKYVSTPASDTDAARVANWGLTISNKNSVKLFDNEYVKDGKKMAVSSVAEQMILAPGTANDANNAFKVSISGTPEVAYKITATINVELAKWIVDDKYYCPVEFYVGNGTTQKVVTAPAAGTADGIELYEKAIEDAIANQFFGATMTGTKGSGSEGSTGYVYEDEYYPGDTDFANFETAKDVVVTWKWPFDGDNAKDTKLGDAKDKATISVSYNFAAEQIGSDSAK